MHFFYLKLFYSFMNLSKSSYICFGLISDHLQGVTTTLGRVISVVVC
jgi:hypothetical protein